MDEDVQQLVGERHYAEALEQLLERYEARIFRMAYAFLKDPSTAEDVTQEIFLKLWRALPDYDGRASLGTWLYAIARNSCLTAVRQEGYRRTAVLDDQSAQPVSGVAHADLELAQCVARLPEIQRLVVTLFYLQEKSVHEVARALDMPDGTVKSHLHRARLALAAMMKEVQA
jgi:RNA polymerase sigma-70 factor, ECF subfamily